MLQITLGDLLRCQPAWVPLITIVGCVESADESPELQTAGSAPSP